MVSSMLLLLLAFVAHTVGNLAPNSGSSACQRDILYQVFLKPSYSSAASSFCSSYIHIPIATATVSVKITAKGPSSTVTITNTPAQSTVVITPIFTATNYVATSTTTVYTTYAPDVNFKQKRNSNQDVPSYCNGHAASEISSACSCLNIPTSTKIVTVTGTVTTPGSTVTQTKTASVAPITITGTPTTTTVSGTTTATETLPTLCDPVNFQNYTGTNDQRPSLLSPNTSANTIQGCCLACYNTLNCLSFMFDGGQCSYYVATTVDENSTNFAYRINLCPFQVTAGSKEVGPGMGVQNYGPCLADSPLEANGCPEPGTIGADYPAGCPN